MYSLTRAPSSRELELGALVRELALTRAPSSALVRELGALVWKLGALVRGQLLLGLRALFTRVVGRGP